MLAIDIILVLQGSCLLLFNNQTRVTYDSVNSMIPRRPLCSNFLVSQRRQSTALSKLMWNCSHSSIKTIRIFL